MISQSQYQARYGLSLSRWLKALFACLVASVALLGGCATARPELAEDRSRKSDLALSILDSEALYTVAADLKPMSSSFWTLRWDEAAGPPSELEEVRRSLRALSTEHLYMDVQIFARSHEGSRSAHAYVIRRDLLSEVLVRHASLFGGMGLSAGSHPAEVVAVVDRAPAQERFRAYGVLFGYPEYAINFFCEAAATEASGGGFVKRDFVSVPTYSSETGRFVYAVPKGHTPNDDDRRIRERAAPVLERYREIRGASPDEEQVAAIWRRAIRGLPRRRRVKHGPGRVGPRVGVSRKQQDPRGARVLR